MLSPARDGSTVLHVVVDPAVGTTTLESALIRRAVQEAPAGFPVHLWLMQATAADDDRAARARGSSPSATCCRCVSSSRSPTTCSRRPGPWPPGRSSRASDEGPWVETNNRAFAGHPEQGAWTVAELQERMAADWVELDGFLVADDPDGPGPASGPAGPRSTATALRPSARST